jgi:hypothetical protein
MGWINCFENNKFDSLNRSVTASPPYGGSGYTKTQSGFALCVFLFRQSFLCPQKCFAFFLIGHKKPSVTA